MVFLFEQELVKKEGLSEYQFQAANFGPFSWRLSNAVDSLVYNHLLDESSESYGDGAEKYQYSLTSEGRRVVREALNTDSNYNRYLQSMNEIKNKYNDMGLRRLLIEIYTRFPEFAEKSQYEF